MLVSRLCLTLCDPMDCSPPGSSLHGDSPGKNTGVGCHVLLQGIFPTQGSNPDLPHWGWILYHLSHQGNPRVLEWVAKSSSRGSSQPKDQTQVSCITGRFFTGSFSFLSVTRNKYILSLLWQFLMCLARTTSTTHCSSKMIPIPSTYSTCNSIKSSIFLF